MHAVGMASTHRQALPSHAVWGVCSSWQRMLAWHCDGGLAPQLRTRNGYSASFGIVVSHTSRRRLCRSISRRGTHRQTSASSPFRAPRRAAPRRLRTALRHTAWAGVATLATTYVHPMRRRAQHTTLQYGVACGSYPGCEFFRHFKSNNYCARGLVPDWADPEATAKLSLGAAAAIFASEPSEPAPIRPAEPSRGASTAQHSCGAAQCVTKHRLAPTYLFWAVNKVEGC